MSPGTDLAYQFVQRFNEVILFPTIGLLAAVALLVFIFGAFEYVVRSGDPAARQQGVKHITWGIVGLVVMLSAYTIMLLFANTFGLGDELDRANQGQIVIPPNPVRGTADTANTGNRGTADDSSPRRGNAE